MADFKQLIQDALVTDMPSAPTLFSLKQDYTPNYIEKGFDPLSKDNKELFKEAGITDLSKMVEFKANNRQHLKQQLDAYKLYKDSEKQLEESGFIPSLAAHAGAAFINPINWAFGGMYGLGEKAANTLVKAESMALAKSIAVPTTIGAVDIGTQEALVEKEAHSYDQTKLATTIATGAVLGGAVGGVAHWLTKVTPEARHTVVKGVEALSGDGNEMLSPLGKALVDVHSQLLRSKNNVVREEALKLEHSTLAVGDKKTGQEIVQGMDTAKDIKNKAEALHNEYMNDVKARAKDSGMPIGEFLQKEYETKMFHDYAVEQEAYKNIINMTPEERIKTYKEATGVQELPIEQEIANTKYQLELLKNEQDIGKQTTQRILLNRKLKELEKKLEPEDMYEVLLHHQYRDLEGKIETPKELEAITKFFSKNTEIADKLGTRGVAGKVGKFYHTRMWNEQYIEKIGADKAQQQIVEMMKAHPLTAHKLSTKELTIKDLEKQAKGMVDKILDNNLRNLFTEPSYIKVAKADNPLKARMMKVDVSMYPEMFKRDAEHVTELYMKKMGGRFAMNAIGIDTTPQLKSFGAAIEHRLSQIKEQGIKQGLSEKEIAKDIDNLKVAYDILMNTRNIVNNPSSIGHKATVALKGTASAIYASGFVKSALGELGSVILNSRLPSVIKSFIPAHKMTMEMMKKGDKSLAKEFISMGIGKQVIEGNRFSRLDLEELKSQTSWWERGLQKMGHYSRKWSGFNFVTATTDFMAAGSFIRDLQHASLTGKLSKRFASQLKRYGLTEKEALSFTKKAKLIYHKDGKTIKLLNMDEWKDQDYAWKITRAIQRMVDDTVLRGDGLKMPKYLTDVNSDLMALFTQYQHFPMEAYGRLLVRGMADSPAKAATSAIAGTTIIASVLELEDQALVTLGFKDEPMKPQELFKRAADRTPIAAIMPDVYNLAKTATGNSDYYLPAVTGRGFGASGHIIDTGWQLYQKAAKGQHFTERDMDNLARLTPFSRYPVYGELLRAITKDAYNNY